MHMPETPGDREEVTFLWVYGVQASSAAPAPRGCYPDLNHAVFQAWFRAGRLRVALGGGACGRVRLRGAGRAGGTRTAVRAPLWRKSLAGMDFAGLSHADSCALPASLSAPPTPFVALVLRRFGTLFRVAPAARGGRRRAGRRAPRRSPRARHSVTPL